MLLVLEQYRESSCKLAAIILDGRLSSEDSPHPNSSGVYLTVVETKLLLLLWWLFPDPVMEFMKFLLILLEFPFLNWFLVEWLQPMEISRCFEGLEGRNWLCV